MSGFSADWLRLREPFDRAARASAAGGLDLLAWAAGWRPAGALTVLDLGCGSGANLRELAPRLGGEQRWRLVDHDAALLAALPAAMADWAAQTGHRCETLAGGVLRLVGAGFDATLTLERRDLAHDLTALGWAEHRLVTGSALLDLVSARWLDDLLARCTGAGCALLFALNVDGRTVWEPADADDAAVHALFAAHQRRDKGFGGAALGPAAIALAHERLRAAGYRVASAPSDWQIGGDAPTMLSAMIDGMATAAAEQAPEAAPRIAAWRQRRLALAGRTRLCVGHAELIAAP